MASRRDERDYYALNARVFRALAPYYDLFVRPIESLRRKVVEMTGACPGAAVLDLATGTGRQARAFAKAGCRVTGVDLSVDMLRIAMRKNRLPGLVFRRADARRLDFPRARFDVVTVSFALHDMPEFIRWDVLRAMARVVRPEGIVVVVDYALPRLAPARWLVFRLVSAYEGPAYREFIRSDLSGELRAAGLRVISERPVLGGVARFVRCRTRSWARRP